MKEIPDSISAGAIVANDDDGLEVRIRRVMVASVVLAVSLSALLSGLLLGGALSLMNYHWMRTSIAALIEARMAGYNAGVKVPIYILRYFLIASIVIAGYKLNAVSLAATIVGLCSFVVALFAEALRQVYLTIVHREGLN